MPGLCMLLQQIEGEWLAQPDLHQQHLDIPRDLRDTYVYADGVACNITAVQQAGNIPTSGTAADLHSRWTSNKQHDADP